MSEIIQQVITTDATGTAAAFTAANPVLKAGETGLETDTGYFKKGDGTTAWNSLEYKNPIPNEYLHIEDQKASGTDGGTFASGSWQTRDLNTIVLNTIPGASLSANQITLPVGEYKITICSQAYRCNSHKLRLRDITNALDISIGLSEYSNGTSGGVTTANLVIKPTISTPISLEIQHQCETTKTTNGYGYASSFGVVEVYTDVFIEKIN